jgi:comEA protein
MNGKERFAGAVLVVTLAIGIIVDVLNRQDVGNSISRQVSDCPAASSRAPYGDFRKLDLNAAGVEELEILPCIGPKKAEAIVEYRERHGRFLDLHRLTEVKGIGEKTLERIAPYVFVSAEVSPASD